MKLWRQVHPVERSGVVVLGVVVVVLISVLVNRFVLQWMARDVWLFVEDWWFVEFAALTSGVVMVILASRERRRGQRY
jgi:hypothetical protein